MFIAIRACIKTKDELSSKNGSEHVKKKKKKKD